jgi:hypothetical protein
MVFDMGLEGLEGLKRRRAREVHPRQAASRLDLKTSEAAELQLRKLRQFR